MEKNTKTLKRYINASSEHIEGIFDKSDLEWFYKRLTEDIPWQTAEWRAGRNLPRLVFRYDEGSTRIEVLNDLRELCEITFECKVRGMWCNLYNTGADWTPPHQDNYGAHVITFSFGSSRRFVCEHIKRKEKTEYLLKDGDVFYFSPQFDKEHKHSIPKTTKKVGPRISIVLFTSEPYNKEAANKFVEGNPAGLSGGIENGFQIGQTIMISQDGHIIMNGQEVEDPIIIQQIFEMLEEGRILI
jgi:hypothetical protein